MLIGFTERELLAETAKKCQTPRQPRRRGVCAHGKWLATCGATYLPSRHAPNSVSHYLEAEQGNLWTAVGPCAAFRTGAYRLEVSALVGDCGPPLRCLAGIFCAAAIFAAFQSTAAAPKIFRQNPNHLPPALLVPPRQSTARRATKIQV
jgi:hypothetical protein